MADVCDVHSYVQVGHIGDAEFVVSCNSISSPCSLSFLVILEFFDTVGWSVTNLAPVCQSSSFVWRTWPDLE